VIFIQGYSPIQPRCFENRQTTGFTGFGGFAAGGPAGFSANASTGAPAASLRKLLREGLEFMGSG